VISEIRKIVAVFVVRRYRRHRRRHRLLVPSFEVRNKGCYACRVKEKKKREKEIVSEFFLVDVAFADKP